MTNRYHISPPGHQQSHAELQKIARDLASAHNVTASNSGDPDDPKVEVINGPTGKHFRITKGQSTTPTGFVNGLRIEGAGNYNYPTLLNQTVASWTGPGTTVFNVGVDPFLLPSTSSQISFWDQKGLRWDAFDLVASLAGISNSTFIVSEFHGCASGDNQFHNIYVYPTKLPNGFTVPGWVPNGYKPTWQPVVKHYGPGQTPDTVTGLHSFDNKVYQETYVGRVLSVPSTFVPVGITVPLQPAVHTWNAYNKRWVGISGGPPFYPIASTIFLLSFGCSFITGADVISQGGQVAVSGYAPALDGICRAPYLMIHLPRFSATQDFRDPNGNQFAHGPTLYQPSINVYTNAGVTSVGEQVATITNVSPLVYDQNGVQTSLRGWGSVVIEPNTHVMAVSFQSAETGSIDWNPKQHVISQVDQYVNEYFCVVPAPPQTLNVPVVNNLVGYTAGMGGTMTVNTSVIGESIQLMILV